jgi:tetratricopeptide (TPR) repeat protein
VTRLDRHYPGEMCLSSALERLAESLRLQSKFMNALPFAERAVALDLFSSAATRQLGLVHFGLADYNRAERELQKSFALDPSEAQTLEFIGQIAWARGAARTSREARRSEFRKVIETFSQALDLANTDADRGRLHFWLGRFHDDILEYDSAEKHYTAAKALVAYPIECRLYLGSIFMEQELLDRAEQHFRDALRETARSWRASGPAPASIRTWLRQCWANDEFTDSETPRAWIVLRVCLFTAQIFAERGRDISRARRRLGVVSRNLNLLDGQTGDPERSRERRLDIQALCEDQRGWLDYLEGLSRPAREHIEASVRIREDPENLCHLARLYLDDDEPDRALECADRARKVDVQGVFDSRLADIEANARAIKWDLRAEPTLF